MQGECWTSLGRRLAESGRVLEEAADRMSVEIEVALGGGSTRWQRLDVSVTDDGWLVATAPVGPEEAFDAAIVLAHAAFLTRGSLYTLGGMVVARISLPLDRCDLADVLALCRAAARLTRRRRPRRTRHQLFSHYASP